MSLLGICLLVLIAAICGAAAQAVVGYTMGGFIASALVGVIGALIGFFIASYFNLPLILVVHIDGEKFPLMWAIIGSVIFVFITSIIAGPGKEA